MVKVSISAPYSIVRTTVVQTAVTVIATDTDLAIA